MLWALRIMCSPNKHLFLGGRCCCENSIGMDEHGQWLLLELGCFLINPQEKPESSQDLGSEINDISVTHHLLNILHLAITRTANFREDLTNGVDFIRPDKWRGSEQNSRATTKAHYHTLLYEIGKKSIF